MIKNSKLPTVDRQLDLEEVNAFSAQLSVMVRELRSQILAPKPRKAAPTFTTTQVAELCGVSRVKLNYITGKHGDFTSGEVQGRSKIFTLAETRRLVQDVSNIDRSPLLEGLPANGRVLTVAQLKGGSTKTTTSLCLAQGLSLLGRKVLLIDLDPQASLTELCGLYAELEIEEEHTVLPLLYADGTCDLNDAVQPTYWDGISLIPAHLGLFDAEFHLPAVARADRSFQFWNVLRKGIESLRPNYDYIIFDTAPSLSYVMINAVMAADSLVMPVVPESLDFVSSAGFWTLFSDLANGFLKKGDQKTFDFISILMTKVDGGQGSSANVVREWIRSAYHDWVSPIEIPSSNIMSYGALAFSTAFDLNKGDATDKALARIREPYLNYCRWIDDQYSGVRQQAFNAHQERSA